MAAGIGVVRVKRERGTLVVQGMGQTPRGTNFIRQSIDLKCKSSADSVFRPNLRTAINEMFAQSVLPL